MHRFYKAFLLLLMSSFSYLLSANNPIYEARRAAYIDNSIAHPNNDVITLQAYKGLPVDQNVLNNFTTSVKAGGDADFTIIQLVRVLELTHGEYDTQILDAFDSIPFWLTYNETSREYWSENHMVMWMSSDWLLHEKYGKVVDTGLETRLRHYLKLKMQYGFYEFFSSTYGPYCLSGLLNLADFSQDAEIKHDAGVVAQRLLKDFMKLTNDKGSFFPTAGRNYPGKYDNPYGQNHNSLIYLLTGLGEVPGGPTIAGAFLASSSVEVDDIINSRTETLDTTYTQGHTLADGLIINQNVAKNDKVVFQWSSGAYFDPLVATSTFQMLKDLNLWGHYEFADFRQFSFLPSSLAPTVAEIASSISKSSGIYNPTISIFKNKSITLSSLQDFWKGKLGYQQFPVVVNSGTSAVYTIAGTPSTDWENRPAHNANSHLPYVQQKSNIALVMYRPEKGLALFGYKDDKLDISLHWQDEKFNEMREDGNWLLGREGDSYVAVRRHSTGYINGVRADDNPDGQTWIYMVGNSDMYGSFDHFEQLINQSQYTEKWYFNLPTLQWVYYAKIVVDGKTLEYAWNGDILSGPTRATGIRNAINTTKEISVYPNPAKDNATIDLSSMLNKSITVKVVNTIGQEIYNETVERVSAPSTILQTSNWPEGMYVLSVECEQQLYTQKILITK